MSTNYTKPNGKTTKSVRAYCLAWRREINLKIEKHYKLTVISFDPGITVVNNDAAKRGRAVDIPLWLAKRMIEVAEKRCGDEVGCVFKIHSEFVPSSEEIMANFHAWGGK